MTGVLTDTAVSKRKTKPPDRLKEEDLSDEPLGGFRVEFQAPPEWVSKLDAAAARLGMGRSAYIRMACNRQMTADTKETQP